MEDINKNVFQELKENRTIGKWRSQTRNLLLEINNIKEKLEQKNKELYGDESCEVLLEHMDYIVRSLDDAYDELELFEYSWDLETDGSNTLL